METKIKEEIIGKYWKQYQFGKPIKLKPLSSITDEHAVEVDKMFGFIGNPITGKQLLDII